jgi:predicted Zn-dependent protease
MKLRNAVTICSLLAWGALFDVALAQSDGEVPEARIILFTPSDIDAPPPEIYRPRLHQFGEYAENFFHQQLTSWGHQPRRKEIFDRGTDRRISVIHVKGDLKAAGDEYKKQWISRQVLGKLKDEHQIETDGKLFWIFVYVGDPPAKHDNYSGSGNSMGGGWAVLNYTNLPGEIDPAADPVADFHNQLFLKGCIHEFGHALGLPHIGPKAELQRGNTLMGPVSRIYVEKKQALPTKAYLSEASAAILSAHPVFTGDASSRNKLPRTEFVDVKVIYDKTTAAISLSGTLKANHSPHRIVVIDDRDDKPGAYWVKGYVSEVSAQGGFAVSIPRPKQCSGKLKVLAVYQNGAVTGGNFRQGIGSAKDFPYSFR